MIQKRILIVDDEENFRHMLSVILKKERYDVETASNGEEGLQKISVSPFDQILCDIRMPHMDGMEFLSEAQKLGIDATIIMMSAYGTIDTAIEAMKLGAYDYFCERRLKRSIVLKI
jgi:two-component system response regulator AtoC